MPIPTIWKCGRYQFELGERTYIMGIVNATPDSFSGDGNSTALAAIGHAARLLDEGADILDIGGESTRPRAAIVSEAEELDRVLPVIEELARRFDIPLSVDTTKAAVARRCLEAGASIVNDISAGTHDCAMHGVLAASSCGCVLMHRRGTPQEMGWSTSPRPETGHAQTDDSGGSLLAELRQYLSDRTETAIAAGIARERICLDAGFGFGKSYEENLVILRRGGQLRELGFALLSATSRKSTIGRAIGAPQTGERIFGTAATVALAIAGGCDIVRVHDVRAMRDVARMTDAVVRGDKPGNARMR